MKMMCLIKLCRPETCTFTEAGLPTFGVAVKVVVERSGGVAIEPVGPGHELGGQILLSMDIDVAPGKFHRKVVVSPGEIGLGLANICAVLTVTEAVPVWPSVCVAVAVKTVGPVSGALTFEPAGNGSAGDDATVFPAASLIANAVICCEVAA